MVQQLNKIRIDAKVSLAYQWINDSNKTDPLLIFLHEGLGSIGQWKDFPEKLCNELNLPGLVYDRYGYGSSTELLEKRMPDYLHKEAEYFLPLLLEKLHLENRKILLIGHSDGASIALLYGALFPNNIMAIVSMAAHVFVEQISIDNILNIEKLYETNSAFRNRLKKYHLDHTDSTFYAFSQTITSEMFRDWNIEDCLYNIDAPVLVIQGENDEYGTVKQVDSIYEKTPNPKKTRLLIENCGHSPHLSRQSTVIEAIKEFITK